MTYVVIELGMHVLNEGCGYFAGCADVLGAAVRSHGLVAHDSGRGVAQRAHSPGAGLQSQPGV
jgi:hypothetical protein